MTLTLELPTETERLLAVRAKAVGKTVEEFALSELERAAKRSEWAEIAAPFAADFAASGMTENELDALVEEAREEIYFEQHGRRSKQP